MSLTTVPNSSKEGGVGR